MADPSRYHSDAILERLLALHPKRIDLSLDRLYRLLDRLGDPHLHLPPVVHVAGTNGKGSLIAYLRAMLEAAGQRTHVYTSPHLVRFNERIRLAGELIPEAALAETLERCERANADDPITFFEITTAAAFLAFAEQPADILLLETGLGGRLDATNVFDRPLLTAITPVALDHQEFLGPDIQTIAGEKAGILKPKVACVIGRQEVAAAHAIQARADAVGCPLILAGRDFQVELSGQRLIWRDGGTTLDLPAPALAGQHQPDNAAMAITCARQLNRFAIDDAAIAAGLTSVTWPGRMQRLASSDLPTGSVLWLDGGHNPAAGQALAASLAPRAGSDDGPVHLILGMLANKDARGFLAAFEPLGPRVHTVAIPGETSSHDPVHLAAIAREIGITAEPVDTVETALARIAQSGHAARVLICGSLYLAGHVLAGSLGLPD